MAVKKRRKGKKSKRKRVSREDVRKNAKKGGGPNWFNLPDGVEDWAPDKAGRYDLDFLPYEVTDQNHPDNIEPGYLWYKRRFFVHHQVGPDNDSHICPKSVGKRCPIHEVRDRLLKQKDDDNEEALKALNGQIYVAFNIVDPDDDDGVRVFAMSSGKFWSYDRGSCGLKSELEEGEDAIMNFFHAQDGKTIRVRFKDATWAGNKFLKAVKFDFKDRDDMDEEEVLSKTVNLDEFLNVLPYEKLKKLFLQDEEEEVDEKPKKTRKKKGKKLPKAKEEEEEEEEDDDDEDDGEDDEEDELGDDNDEDSDDDEDEEEEEEDDDSDDDEEDDDEEEEEEEEDEVEPPKRKKKSKKKPPAKKKVTKKKSSKKKAPKKKITKKKGKKPVCPVEGGTFGQDVDEYDECDDCPIWDACEEASET